MKSVVLFLAVLGLASGKFLPTRNLQDDLNDFLELIPTEQVVAIVMDYAENDAEVHEALIYLLSDEFEKIVVTIDTLPEFLNFLNFLEERGLQAYGLFNEFLSGLKMPTIAPPVQRKNTRRGVGINGLIDDIIAVLPIEDIVALLYEKLETSPDFKAFYDAVRGPEFQSIVATLVAIPEYQDLKQKLRDKGVDIDHFIDLIKTFFGLNRGKSSPTRNLQDDLQDFLALIPIEEMTTIVFDYLANDAEVQEALNYLQSDEFEKIVVTVDALPQFRNFLKFLQDEGLNVVQFLNQIHGILGIPTIAPVTSKKQTRRGVGISGLISDLLAILPLEELEALFQEKLETSPDFKALYDAIRSPEFQSIVQTLNAMPEYQDLLQRLRDRGVDVDYFIQLIRNLFGLDR